MTLGRSTGIARISARNCMVSSLFAIPPSTRRTGAPVNADGQSARIASMRSRVWKPTDSSVARAISASPELRVSPKIAQRACVGRRPDDLEPVAQPLNRGAGDEQRALERVSAFAIELVGDGREQAVVRGDALQPGVEHGKAAGAVGGLDHARLEAAVTDGRRLLIAGDAANGDRTAEQIGRPEVGSAVAHLR